MTSTYQEKIVMSVGGSLIATDKGINTEFLKELNTFLRKQIAEHPHRQFFLVSGGGTIARRYRDAGRDVVGHELTRDDLDYLGIHATKLNAHLIRTIFRDIAHPYILKHYEIIRKVTEPIVVAAGWKPGWSTDYCALLLCEDYDVRTVINMSNIIQDPAVRNDFAKQPLDLMGLPIPESLRKPVVPTPAEGLQSPMSAPASLQSLTTAANVPAN